MPIPKHYDLDYLSDNHEIIGDDTDLERHLAELDAKGLYRGLVPRDFSVKPAGCYAFAPVYPQSLLLDPSQYASYFAAQQSGELPNLWAIREANYEVLKSLDQDSLGLCWNFSSTKTSMYQRVLAGMTPIILSPWYTAGLIKNWRDQGGNGDESLAQITSGGVCELSFCPSYSRKYDTPEAAANAKLNRLTNWYDAGNNIEAALTSAGLQGYGGVGDFNDIGHSMAFCYIVSLNPFVTAWDNSWNAISDYGPKGLYIRKGRGAIPDNFFVAVGIEASAT